MQGTRSILSFGLAACLSLAACTQSENSPAGSPPQFPEDSGSILAAVPLDLAVPKDGQIFPAFLSKTDSGCNYPAVSNPPVLDEHSSEWYSSHLRAAHEPSLVELAAFAPDRMHLRFLWLRSFDQPMIVRVDENNDGQAKITAMLLSGAGGYEPGQITKKLNRVLSATEWKKLKNLVAQSALASEPAVGCDMGMDGAQWILEVVENGEYSFYERWSPTTGNIRNVGLYMLRLTEWDLEPVY
jgi:hypothetical protein